MSGPDEQTAADRLAAEHRCLYGYCGDVGADVDAPGLGLFGFLAGLTAGLVVAVLLVVGILGLTVWTGLGGLGFAYVCGAAGGWAATRRSSR